MTKHLFLLGALAMIAAGAACDRVVDLIGTPDGGFPVDGGSSVIDTGVLRDGPFPGVDAPPFEFPDAPSGPYDAAAVAPIDPGPPLRSRE